MKCLQFAHKWLGNPVWIATPVLFLLLSLGVGLRAQPLPQRPYFHLPVGGMADSCLNPATPVSTLFLPRLWYGMPKHPVLKPAEAFEQPNADVPFYFLLALLLFTAISRFVFPKYFADLHRVIFQTGFRQKSLREQLQQNSLASLVLNLIFFVSGGTFLFLAARHLGLVVADNFWLMPGLSIGFIAAIYIIKYFALDLARWLFGLGESLDTYKFIVFVLNKLLGLVLLPFILLLWLGSSALHPIVFTLAVALVGFIFIYRYILAFPVLRLVGKLSGGHFLLYLCAFEIVPILLITKILLSYLIR